MTDHVVKVMDLDVPNRNNRIYPTAVVQEALENVKLPMMGVIGEPEDHLTVSLSRVSHAVENFEIRDGAVWASVKVLKTPAGQALQALLDNDVKVGYGIVGTGNVGADGTVTDLNIISVSVVDGDPWGIANEAGSN